MLPSVSDAPHKTFSIHSLLNLNISSVKAYVLNLYVYLAFAGLAI